MSFVYNLIQRRLEHSTYTLEQATQSYNQTLAQYGAGSEKTTTALQKLQLAQQDLNRAQVEGRLNFAIMIVQSALLGARIAEIIMSVAPYVLGTGAMAAADAAHTGVLLAKAKALALATAGISAIIGTAAMIAMSATYAGLESSSMGIGTTSTTGSYGAVSIKHEAKFSISDERAIDDVYSHMSEQAKQELRRVTSP
jgi:exonuclease VII small subunit